MAGNEPTWLARARQSVPSEVTWRALAGRGEVGRDAIGMQEDPECITRQIEWEDRTWVAGEGGEWPNSRSERPKTWGFLYFVGADDGPIKIGWTSEEPERRLSSLQCGNHRKLEIYGVIKCPRSFEKKIHEELRFVRQRGEWFDRYEALEELGDLRLQITILGFVAELAGHYRKSGKGQV